MTSRRPTCCRASPPASFIFTFGLTERAAAPTCKSRTATPIPKLEMRELGSFEVGFDDVFVPDGDVVGEVSQGWRQVMGSLNSERTMTAAVCTGILEGVLETALVYAKEREAFGEKIGGLQAV